MYPRPRSRALSRRTVLRYGLGATAVAALGGCGVSGGSSQGGTVDEDALDLWRAADVDWTRHDGATLVIQVQQHPWVDAIRPDLASFTELTGIEVNLLTAGESDLITKLPIQLKGGSPTPDVMLVPSYPQYVANDWLADLGPYVNDAELTDKAFYDVGDVFPVARSFVGWDRGGVYGVPITSEVETVFYRSDLVDGDLSTYEALYAAAKAANSGDRAGIALRGKAEATMAWTCQGFVFGNGGVILDPKGKPVLDSPESIEAVDYYARLLQDAGPTGSASWDWQQANQAFTTDQSAIIIESSVFAGEYYDPAKNANADKVAAAPFPTNGSTPLSPNFWHWVLGVNANSENAEAGWLFLQWATCPETSKRLARQAVAVPRQSVWASSEFRSAYGEQASKVVLDMYENAKSEPYTDLYTDPTWPKVGTAFAVAMSSVIAGESDAASALGQAQSKAMRV